MQVLVGRIETLFRFLAGTRPPSDPRPSDPLKGMTVEKFGDAAVLVFSRNGDMHPDRIINAFDALKARGTDPIAIVGDTSVIAPLLRSGEPTRLLTYSPNHDANTILREQVLPAAIAGDQTARNIYQMARLINPDDIPGARKVAIIAELAEFRNQFVLTQAHLGEQKLPLGASFELLPQDKEDVFVEFAVIHEVPTHWQAMKLFEMARDQSEIPVQVISTGSWEFAATIGSFYPMDPRALGRHALRIAPKIFDEILQLHILTDYLESSGIELKASAKISLFDRLIPRSATGEMQERCSPWEFTKSRDFQLIDSIRDQLNQSGLTLAPEKRGTILTRVFYDASPEERLKVEIARATAARDHSEKKQKPKGRESGGEKGVPSVASEKEVFFQAVTERIGALPGTTSQQDYIATLLWECRKRLGMRLDAIDQLKGEAATSMIGHLERIKADALAKRASESAASLDSSIENPEPENKTPQPAPEFEIQFLTIDGKSSFQKSLASIESPKARRAINSLVDRIGSGLSEGSKPVIGADSDIHIRVAFAHLNGGPRVYFVRRGKTIVFLTCGLEADTVSDSIFALRHGHSVIKSLEAKGV